MDEKNKTSTIKYDVIETSSKDNEDHSSEAAAMDEKKKATTTKDDVIASVCGDDMSDNILLQAPLLTLDELRLPLQQVVIVPIQSTITGVVDVLSAVNDMLRKRKTNNELIDINE